MVTAIDGKTVSGESDVSDAIGQAKPGNKITVTYERGGKSATATITLGTRPS